MDFGSASDVGDDGEADAAGVQGTPLAMAPEVLGGAPATPASDLYSLGVLLFRNVSTRYPVEAESLEQLREKLARAPLPSLRTLRPDVPLAFSRVIERALERDPARRPASAAEMERLLAEALSSDWGVAPPAAPRRSRPGRRVWAGAAVGVALAALLAGAWWLRRPAPTPTPPAAPPMQFTLQLPPGEHLPQYANVVVSPDGGTIAFASTDSTGRSALWIRRFDARGSLRVPGTQGARYPFWSPDSREIGFFAQDQLWRVGTDGGAPRVVCRAELGRGGSWSGHGTILFAGSTQGPLMRVPAEGGTPVPGTVLDSAGGETSHRWPSFLPDGEHFLFVSAPDRKGQYGLFVGSLRSDRRAFIGPVESGAIYTSGMLVYVFNKTLEARPFSLRGLRWNGDPVPISELSGLGGSVAEPHASVSQNGTLVYSSLAAHLTRLQWIDVRTGRVTNLSTGPYFNPSLSPDGRHIAVERIEGTGVSNIWMVDAASGAAERWTNDGGLNRAPKWSPAGDSIVFASNRNGRYELYVRGTDGSLAERLLYSPPRALLMWPNGWAPGGLFTYDQFEPGTSYNVYEMHAGRHVAMAHTAAAEMRGALSPDGRWLAYDSDASGRTQVYLVNRATSERFVLSGEAGLHARWARVSGHLFYHSPAGVFFEVTPVPGRRPAEWPSRRRFHTGVLVGFDVDARGGRVLCGVAAEQDRPEEITVLANLPQALARGL
jgi:Tol biopolymer transport system component